MKFPIDRATRGALLGTTALVVLGSPSIAADITVPPNVPNVTLTAGDNLIVNAGGSIGVSPTAVSVPAITAGSISNNGGIFGTTFGISISSTGQLSGGISNGGTIDGSAAAIVAISSSTIQGAVTNDGTISGGVGVISLLNSDIVGGVTNRADISASVGVVVRSAGSISGGIDNSGLVGAGSIGINLTSGGSIGGGIVNSGTIFGTSIGIDANSFSTLSGGINNSGTIFGGLSGVGVNVSSLITGGITNTGLIGGPGAAIIATSRSTIEGGIDNQRTIAASSLGIAAITSASISGGISNSGTITVGGFGALITSGSSVSGGIDNSGLISASAFGILISSSSEVIGGIQNSGTISAGALAIVIGANSSVSGGITNESLISANGPAISISVSSEVSGGLMNSGLITSGSSVAVLIDNSSTITGALINSGTISAPGPGLVVSDSSMITNGLTNRGLIVSQSTDAIIIDDFVSVTGGLKNSGTISGFGDGIEIDGTSVITGGIVNSGLIFGSQTGIDIDDASTISGGLTNTGTISGAIGIQLQPSSVIEGGITNSGLIVGTSGSAIEFGDDDDLLLLQTGSTLVGASDGGSGDDRLMLSGTGSEDDNFTAFEQLDMNGEDWTLSGLVTLSAGGLSGVTNINSGILSVNGALTSPGGVNIAPGATLGGTGTITGAIANLGTIGPGNSVGILSIVGDVAFAAGSSFDVEVDGAAIDLLAITGSATVSPNATLNVLPLSGFADVNGQIILTTTAGVDANFVNVETNGLAAVAERVGGTEIQLSTLNPSALNGGVQGTTNDGFAFQQALGAQIESVLEEPDRRLWGLGFYDSTQRDQIGIFSGYDQKTGGTAFGIDGLFSEKLRLGGAIGYSSSEVAFKDTLGEVDIETYHAGLYGLYNSGALSLSFGATGGLHESDLERAVRSAGTLSTVRSKADGYLFGARGKASWDVEINPGWTGRLNIGVNYLRYSQDGYTDTLGVGVDESSANTFRAGPSFDVIGKIKKTSLTIKPRLSVGFYEQWSMGDREIDVTFANGLQTTASLDQTDEGFAALGVGTDLVFNDRVTTYVSYDGAFSTEQESSQFNAGLRVGF